MVQDNYKPVFRFYFQVTNRTVVELSSVFDVGNLSGLMINKKDVAEKVTSFYVMYENCYLVFSAAFFAAMSLK